MSKKFDADEAISNWSFTLTATFLPPLAIMLGAGSLGHHWGYWHSFLIDNMIFLPIEFAGIAIARSARRR